jgi:hypothetical protein
MFKILALGRSDAGADLALVDKTPETACQLISNIAANSKQFGTHGYFPSKRVNVEADS